MKPLHIHFHIHLLQFHPPKHTSSCPTLSPNPSPPTLPSHISSSDPLCSCSLMHHRLIYTSSYPTLSLLPHPHTYPPPVPPSHSYTHIPYWLTHTHTYTHIPLLVHTYPPYLSHPHCLTYTNLLLSHPLTHSHFLIISLGPIADISITRLSAS